MNRRSFFATLFGGLLCKFLPKRFFAIPPTRVDTLDISKWGRLWPKSIEADLRIPQIIAAENVIFTSEGTIRSYDGSKPSFVTFGPYPIPTTWGMKYYQTKPGDGTWANLSRKT